MWFEIRFLVSFCLFVLFLIPLTGQVKDVVVWRTVFYNDTDFRYVTSNQAEISTTWRNVGFDDSHWQTGQGGVGYGDNDDNTQIPQVGSVFLRTQFTISDTSEIGGAILNMSYDDAFVAFLNGVEIARSLGLSDAFPTYNIFSTVSHEASMLNGGVPETFQVEDEMLKNVLKQGNNVLAIQVHNTGVSSSDLSSNTWFSVGLKSDTHNYQPLPTWFTPPVSTEFSSNLPIMVIETENNQPIVDEPKTSAHMGLIFNGNGERNSSNDPFNAYDGNIGIELRGNSTQGFPKKPYNFETRDTAGENLNTPLLGMPEENDWVLRASYLDHTFVRNGLADFMSRETDRWACRTRHVEIIVNGEYQGIYILMEDIKRDDNRLDIAKLDSNEISGEDMTGGYIWEITGFESSFGESRKIKYPKLVDIRPEQLQYIKDFDDAFRNKMRASASVYANPNSGYVEHINVESFVFEALVQEAMRNSDAYGWSGYFHKDKNALIHAGPVWDFDQSAGNSSYPDNGVVEGWMMEHPSTSNTPFFWRLLLNDPYFKYSMKLRWEEMRSDKFSNEKLFAYIDSVAITLSEAQTREFAKWPVLGADIWRETIGFQDRNTYQKEVDYLKTFLAARWNWIDNQLKNVQRPAFYPEIYIPGAITDTVLYIERDKYYFELNEMFHYPFTSGLDYFAQSSDDAIVEADVNKEKQLKLKLINTGICTIHIKAKDTYGNAKSTSFSVDVRFVDNTGIEHPSIVQNQLIVSPNPAKSHFTVKLKGGETLNGDLSIYNMAGQLVDQRQLIAESQFNYQVGNLKQGTYLLKITDKKGQNYTHKLVIR